MPSPAAPPAFYRALGLYHLFPLHAPLTLFLVDAPFGRFARGGAWHVDGNLAWAAMELVAPITFVSTLLRGPSLTAAAKVLAALYVVHYAHRAVLSPLVLSPPRSPQHAVVPLAAAVFNLVNGYVLAAGLGYAPPPAHAAFWLPVLGWALGFAGNVYHDEILNDLRRPPGKRLVSSPPESGAGPGGRYKVPHGGLFALVSFPNYLCEWFEWTCFALAAAPGVWVSTPAALGWLPGRLLAPPWMFVLAEITSMAPRAVRGHRWYRDKFDDYPKERRAVVPWLL